MKKLMLTCGILMALFFTACKQEAPREKNEDMGVITETTVQSVIDQLTEKYGADRNDLIQRGVSQVAALWKEEDGKAEDFEAFCLENYQGNEEARKTLFDRLSRNYELIWGHMNQMSLELNKPLHLDWGPIEPVDVMFGSYSPSAHLDDDFFGNKLAFMTILNFPFYKLEEKAELGPDWNRLEWAYARMGDIYNSRVPSHINQEASRISTESDNYISEYNIIMDKLVNDEGEALFPENLHLITHWGLRDEIKSNYALAEGLEKQEMIYQVMQRIIAQDIPEMVINNPEVLWNPYTNEVFKDGQAVETTPEPDTRYQYLLSNFQAAKEADPYSPNYPTAIDRAFNAGLELTQQEVEELFVQLVSSPQAKAVGELISQRLGRSLKPFDIWYDGFKSRSSISEQLNEIVGAKYPTREAFEADLPNILVKLGWSADRAKSIASKVKVESSRGAGHAWGAQMREQNSYLRTRIGENGMDYKGYNIAVHEFGHNLEQTITLHDVDYFMMSGVPNTAFTETTAFLFQMRDLKLLGIDTDDPNADHMRALDNFWSCYEIMGVSLVDMAVWQWMYENPEATPAQLKEKTMEIAIDTWNKYYAPVFGLEDSPILAIYSHMISYPLYLSAYPLGHLIEFQVESQLKGKNLASEIDRMYTVGRLIPQEWMKLAVGEPISSQPILNAVEEALKHIQ
ncbi:MAG: hypothetical protein V2I46_08250 [Bacteroides sp.]|jgi:hypothetical protein|nr:hypothetical protein [Bacteroides sp.]